MALKIEVIKSNRKSISMELRPDKILVRAPLRMTKAEITAFVRSKQDWIEAHMPQVRACPCRG